MWEPKLGDVVTLRSAPEQRLTVTGYDNEKKMYGVFWLTPDGNGHAVGLPPCALAAVSQLGVVSQLEAQLNKQVGDLQATIAELQAENTRLNAYGANVHEELTKALLVARTVIPEVDAETRPSTIMQALVDRAETLKREGNSVIQGLQKKLVEAGIQ